MIRPPTTSTLFPYTTLFRSRCQIPFSRLATLLGLGSVSTESARENFPLMRFQRVGKLASLRSEEHTSELQSFRHLVCRLLLEKKKYRVLGAGSHSPC